MLDVASSKDKLDGAFLGDEFVDPSSYMIMNRSDPIQQSNNKDAPHLNDAAMAVFIVGHYMNSASYYGIQVTSDVYTFSVNQDEKSGIFIQINNHGDSDSNLNGISVGWHVHPAIYGDSNTHLFVLWTRDGYQEMGCYNLECPGFVPEANVPFVPGVTINAVSDPDGVKRSIIFKVFKDRVGDWLVHIGFDSEPYLIGRFPKSIFTTLGDKANDIRIYGAVRTRTTYMTPMGSGFMSNSHKAASFSNIQLIDQNGQTSLVTQGAPDFVDDQAIYSVSPISPEGRFTYGGPLV
ncbi:hypothetical protein EJB05_07056, partial [Eragrostis curvula]